MDILSELNDLFDEIVKLKSEIVKINSFIAAHNNTQTSQNKKIQIIHNLFNNLKNKLPNNELLVNELMKSKKFSQFYKKIEEMHTNYNEYRKMRLASNTILENAYSKLEYLNDDIETNYKKLEKENIELKKKVLKFEEYICCINKLELNDRIIKLENQLVNNESWNNLKLPINTLKSHKTI